MEIRVPVSDRCVSGEAYVGALCVRWSAVVAVETMEGARMDGDFPRWVSVLLFLCDLLSCCETRVRVRTLVSVVVIGGEVVPGLCAVLLLRGDKVGRHGEW